MLVSLGHFFELSKWVERCGKKIRHIYSFGKLFPSIVQLILTRKLVDHGKGNACWQPKTKQIKKDKHPLQVPPNIDMCIFIFSEQLAQDFHNVSIYV